LTCFEALKGSLRRGCNSFLKIQTSELVRGAFTKPISPPLRGTSLRGKTEMVFPIGTEEKIRAQCPYDIALTPLGVAVGKGFK
jgi:hypothetical protein